MAKITLFIGDIRPLPESGRPSGIYKQAVASAQQLGSEGFIGDHQADRRVHGGPDKAVHLYPSAHYARLAARFPDAADRLLPGSIGENIACAELDEAGVRIGDVWRLGEARLQVCQPRSPCWKIDERYGCDGMAAFIAEQRLTGWYWRVLTPGTVAPGDELLRERTDDTSPTLATALALCQAHRPAVAELRALAAAPGIAEHWQRKIRQRIDWLEHNAR